jgi:serine/threonine protein kinase
VPVHSSRFENHGPIKGRAESIKPNLEASAKSHGKAAPKGDTIADGRAEHEAKSDTDGDAESKTSADAHVTASINAERVSDGFILPVMQVLMTNCSTGENLESSLESLPPDRRIEQASPRPDLDNPNASKFDRKVVDTYRQMLDIERCFQGTGDELSEPSIVEEHNPIDETRGSVLIRVKIGREWFACKKCWTPTQVKWEMYEKEVEILKTLRKEAHWHVILLLCHYNLQDKGCLVLSPLAQCNLKQYLQYPPTQGRRRSIAKWFGCLAKGLSVLHSQKIKHKDLKPANILIHGENVLIADMGISHPWVDQSTTTGTSPGSKMYMAPEVLGKRRRGRRQDIWSLLCCYIEMFAYLIGTDLPEFRASADDENQTRTFHHNYDRLVEWLKFLKVSTQLVDDRMVLDFIIKFFQPIPNQRPLTPEIVEYFRQIGHGDKYIGECCASGSISVATTLSRQTAAISLSSNTPLQSQSSLVHFVENARRDIMGALTFPAVNSTFNELLQEVNGGRVKSIRSAEKKLLLYIAPVSLPVPKGYIILILSSRESAKVPGITWAFATLSSTCSLMWLKDTKTLLMPLTDPELFFMTTS